MKNIVKDQKICEELVILDEIFYYVEPANYYDDGSRKIYKLIDSDENIYVWKTSKTICVPIINNRGDKDFDVAEVGDKVLLKGIVKDMNQFRGEDQIVLTRCKTETIIKHQYFSKDQIIKIKRDMQLSKFKNYEIKTMSYGEYKNDYQKYETLFDSFIRTDKGCFIDVIVA